MQRRSEKEHRLKSLAKMPLFAHLSPVSLHFLAERLVPRQLEPGEVIFSEGHACEGLYVVEAGLVKLYKVSKDGREQVLATHDPGQTLSELPMTDGETYPFSAAALVKSTLLFISTEKLHTLCQHEPDCTRQVLSIVAARLRNALGMIEELSFSTVRARLAAYLPRMGNGRPLQNGHMVQLPTGQDIAAHIGTVRELVSRHLNELQASGIIRVSGRKMQVLHADALAKQAAGFSGRTKPRKASSSRVACRLRQSAYPASAVTDRHPAVRQKSNPLATCESPCLTHRKTNSV